MRALRRIYVAMLVVALSCALAEKTFAQSTPPFPSPGSNLGWLDHWRLSTFSFGIKDQDQKGRQFFRVIGTGIIIAPKPEEGYIVTAKHVFDDPAKNWHPAELQLRFSWQETRCVRLPRNNTSAYQFGWTAIVDPSADGADVAAIPLNAGELGLNPGVQPHAISTRDIASTDDMFEGANAVVLGYPGIVGNEYLVRSIVRGGIISWLNPEDPFNKPFLIDANIYPGNSGGPVIRVPTGVNRSGGFVVGGRPTLLGIVSKAPGLEQDIRLNVPGSPGPLELKQTVPLGGTGVIEPASKIPAIIEQLSASHIGLIRSVAARRVWGIVDRLP